MIDSHSHIYSEEFDEDRAEVIERAISGGVSKIILPNIDAASLQRMLKTEAEYSDCCYAAIGLHPTSVDENFNSELELVKNELERRDYVAIGEIGIDLYWDKKFLNEQITVFRRQLEWALEYNLPVIIHVRDSFNETMKVLNEFAGKGLTGVFHSFTGNIDDAVEIINFGGFYMGINGIVTFKNSGLSGVVEHIGIDHLLLETDSPYLTPSPYRGKRNESAYLGLICKKIADIFGKSEKEIDDITTRNVYNLFKKIS